LEPIIQVSHGDEAIIIPKPRRPTIEAKNDKTHRDNAANVQRLTASTAIDLVYMADVRVKVLVYPYHR